MNDEPTYLPAQLADPDMFRLEIERAKARRGPKYPFIPIEDTLELVECPGCDGRGTWFSPMRGDIECDRCKGAGKVPEEDE